MGTHPIFESDFDCLTEKSVVMSSHSMGGEHAHRAARVKLYHGESQYKLHIDQNMEFAQFLNNVKGSIGLQARENITLKYIDDEGDPILLTSDQELVEMLRITPANQEYIYIHAFGGRVPNPGKPCDGENKAIYRRNARRWDKFKRQFKRRPKIPIAEPITPVSPGGGTAANDSGGHESGNDKGNDTIGGNHGNIIIQHPAEKGFSLEDFDLVRVIGRGSYAKVLLVRLKPTKRLYAMKVIKKELVCDEEDIDWVQTEKHVFETASNHPFLVGLHSCFQSPTRLFFVIEYINGGDLMFHMQRQRKLPEEHARFYSAEITLALHFLHERGIIYRDLKLDNVLLDSEGHIRLTDYGMCKEGIRPGDTTSTFCGTPNYIAPEILRAEDYGFSVDWWALGVLLYEMLAGRSPFDIVGATDNPDQNTEDYLFQVILEKTIRIPRSLSVKAASILKGFLNKNPADRLGCHRDSGFGEIMNHPFFKTIEWAMLEQKQIPPPYRPRLENERDLANFPPEFTDEPVQLTPDDPGIIGKIDQTEFEGFEYVNPLLMSAEDVV